MTAQTITTEPTPAGTADHHQPKEHTMTNNQVPEWIVEHAAQAAWDALPEMREASWEATDAYWRAAVRADIRAALNAAAPLIRALDEDRHG